VSVSVLGVDAYQLTTLVAHASLGRLDHEVAMAFFFRSLPPQRNYVVFAGLPHVLAWCAALRFGEEDLAVLEGHDVLGPALRRHPEVLEHLRSLDGFRGEVQALPEGTLAFAGPARDTAGHPVEAGEAPLWLYTPLLQVRTDLVRAKLLETPWLSRVNFLSMVASKASRVVSAAAGRPVLEFGARRTHPDAAVDVAYAAHLAGCTATSNVAAGARWGIPSRGTMDHFAVQASEQPGAPVADTERAFFAAFGALYPESSVMLVDTYDTERGLRGAARAAGARLGGVRLDSSVTPASVRRAREILAEEGSPHAQIVVSDSLDEWKVQALAAAGADAFGVGENIACSPDAATGVGAVAKLVVNGYGKITMKLSRGSGKASLPGLVQVWRTADHDLVGLADEPGPPGGRALLSAVWSGNAPVGELPSLAESRAWVAAQVAALPRHLRDLRTDHGRPWPLVVSDRLLELVRRLEREAA
jgi:nicotinate phosphoribosyltransferase